jgi:hypothetical protein
VVEWCKSGPPYAEVSAVDTSWEEPQGLQGFSIS